MGTLTRFHSDIFCAHGTCYNIGSSSELSPLLEKKFAAVVIIIIYPISQIHRHTFEILIFSQCRKLSSFLKTFFNVVDVNRMSSNKGEEQKRFSTSLPYFHSITSLINMYHLDLVWCFHSCLQLVK